ncbi:MAG: T9SS type A sorting domain-containing protein [Ignavibacteriales bacterium]|nr:T9SS type A sorting domain-containing protein [Ignavibacteriales bacterium]
MNHYTWTANAAGGISPLSYAWYKDFGYGSFQVGTGTSYSEDYGYAGYCEGCTGTFTLTCNVTDAVSQVASTSMGVTVYYWPLGGGGGGYDPKMNGSNAEMVTAKEIPSEFSIGSYPNPFNPSTLINYQLPVDGTVTLSVFDVLGREVETLVNGTKPAGYYTVPVDASQWRSGVYFARIAVTTNKEKPFTQTIKMLLTR